MIFVTDSCADLTKEQVAEMHLKVVPMTVEIEGTIYEHHPDERMLKVVDFYQRLRDKKVAKTSLVNTATFMAFFEPFLKEGADIFYVAFSSALSGTYQSAVLAAEELKESYPNQKIVCVDSKCASMGQGLLLHYIHLEIKKGLEIEALKTYVEQLRDKVIHLFTVDDLGTLKRGGRLSDTQAFLGSLLRIKPILHVSDEGKLVPLKKARGRAFAIESMVALVGEKITDPTNQTIFISHGDCLDEAKNVGKMIEDTYHVKDIVYNTIGPIIGAHSGPGTIAVFFIGNKR